jgi:hypothetical protein
VSSRVPLDAGRTSALLLANRRCAPTRRTRPALVLAGAPGPRRRGCLCPGGVTNPAALAWRPWLLRSGTGSPRGRRPSGRFRHVLGRMLPSRAPGPLMRAAGNAQRTTGLSDRTRGCSGSVSSWRLAQRRCLSSSSSNLRSAGRVTFQLTNVPRSPATDRLTGRTASSSGDGECPQHLEALIGSAQVPAMFIDEHLSTWDVRC